MTWDDDGRPQPGRGRVYGSRSGSPQDDTRHTPPYRSDGVPHGTARPESHGTARPESHGTARLPRYAVPHGSAEAPARRKVNGRVVTTVAVSVALVIGLITLGWAMVKPDSATGGPRSNAGGTAGSTSPATMTPSVTATPKPSAKTTPKPTQTKPRITVTKKPPAAQLPPPPPPPKSESPTCTKYIGTKATPAEVEAALLAAGSTDFWGDASPPAGVTEPLPPITVPPALMKAVAFTESSWISNVIACDGGIGTMQVMPGTASFVNQRFGLSEDVNTLSGNTRLGAAYLEWLTVYFGLYYFGTFDLDATAPVDTDGSDMRLRDAVIAAYNVGPAAVEDDHGTEDGADDTLSIPNQWYVDRVVGYLSNCPCDSL